jgi:peptidoglycan/LPS O-acetylase OafA/YrhL
MKKKTLLLPLIITGVLMVSAFIPVLQVLILTLNGGFLYLFEMISKTDTSSLQYVVNAFCGVLLLILYFLSKKTIARVLTAIGVVFFVLPLLMYSFENTFTEGSPYFLQFMVIGLLTGFILLLVSYFKDRL